jgi:hypothetical protein
MARKIYTYNMSEPLTGAPEAKIDINTVDGNLKIGSLRGGHELVSGSLQYLESQEPPTHSVNTSGSQAKLIVQSGKKGQPWFRLPWAACNGATEWQIQLNPTIALDITAQSGGGNVQLELTGLTVTRLTAETGGGNMEVFLPDRAAGLQATIKSGAGNVTVHLPNGVAARIHATTGLGKVIMDRPYSQIDKSTYQSPGYENAVEKIEITASSGAGNVSIKEKIWQTSPAAVRV